MLLVMLLLQLLHWLSFKLPPLLLLLSLMLQLLLLPMLNALLKVLMLWPVVCIHTVHVAITIWATKVIADGYVGLVLNTFTWAISVVTVVSLASLSYIASVAGSLSTFNVTFWFYSYGTYYKEFWCPYGTPGHSLLPYDQILLLPHILIMLPFSI